MNSEFKLDFIGIGSPRCGTTWISSCLQEHPEVNFATSKETDFFIGDNHPVQLFNHRSKWTSGIQSYISEFPSWEDTHKVRGEFSVSYFADSVAPKRISELYPNIKIIIALRDPVDMITSYFGWLQNSITSNNIKKLSFDELMTTNFVNYGKYGKNLKRYLKYFNKDQIHIVWFEDIENDPKLEIKKIFDFINVDSTFVPVSASQIINKQLKTNYTFLNKMAAICNQWKKIPMQNKILQFLYGIYSKINHTEINGYQDNMLTKSQKNNLRKKLNKDITQLEEITQKDLTKWKLKNT